VSEDAATSRPGRSLSTDGLGRLGQQLGVDGVPVARRLPGGAACDVFVIEVARDHEVGSVVLKIFPPDNAGSATFEWAALTTAVQAPIPTTEPIAFDEGGGWFGTPSIVMSRVPGSPVWEPTDVAEWTRQLALSLARIHETAAGRVPPSLTRPAIWQRWTPEGLPSGLAESVQIVLARLTESTSESGLCHGDFHPGNVLFEGSVASGVVDWVSARWGPTLSDVGRCRSALSIWPGGDAPDRFLEHYSSAVNRSVDGLGYWDALSGALTFEHGPRVAASFRDLGMSVDEELVLSRSSAFLAAALRRAAP
jgi:Ser/Thr protein kinase RdoA (MazF antagonist)